MIKLTNGQIRHPGFNPALSKLLSANVEIEEAKRLVEIMEGVRNYQAKSDIDLAGIVMGKIPPLIEPLVEAFNETEVIVNCLPISISSLAGVKMSGLDLIMLKGIIE